ncbi:Helicase [Macrophomina phaseolina MS6]|uniref:RNA helicase n=1 Tax=Macrophomina phaseolina (strain MS6) TaxID=1126212 RepID=K2S603_MACPH|nr:Helicase [Macrophomina phaseolina MS6]
MIEAMGVKPAERDKHWSRFEDKLRRKLGKGRDVESDEEMSKLVESLQRAYRDRSLKGVDQQLRNAFLGHVASTKSFSQDDYQNQKALADLRYPTEWFPATRKMQRKIILHVGPTNSGKTYHALKRLEQAETGAYAGPLRLLAHEVYTRMNAKGAACALITGEERRRPPGEDRPKLTACTVEMIPLHMTMDVCVIDEIQMIGDLDRGWAWTQAVLGVQAKELHLCGEARTVPLIRELAATMGDEVEVNTYERLTSLEMDTRHIGYDFKNLRKGDCIVAFSIMEIHALRQTIMKQTGKKVAIVYGSLPPETRAHQARLFNDPNSGYDILVASDAIGMGLNLSVKRIIFASIHKFNGFEHVTLSIPHLKQIAGRAGRYKTAHEANKEAEKAPQNADAVDASGTILDDFASEQQSDAPNSETEQFEFAEPPPGGGLVTTLEKAHMRYVSKALKDEPEAIKTAGLFPPDPIIERFANYFPPGTPFSYVLLRLHDISRVHKRFHICVLKDQLSIADTIQAVDGLSVLDRITFCAAPANLKTDKDREVLLNLAKCVAEQKNGNLLDIEGFDWTLLDRPISANREYLHKLESLHKAIVLYLWLSYRFSGVFATRALAFHAKTLVEQAIEATLNELTRTRFSLQYLKEKQREQQKQQQREQFRDELLSAELSDEASQGDEGDNIISGGSLYEQADVLDGAEEGEAVRPVEVEHEPALDNTEDDGAEPADLPGLKKIEARKRDELDPEPDASTLDVNEVEEFLESEDSETNLQNDDANTNTARSS